MSVTFQDVRFRAGEREILRGVDVSLTEQRIGLVGANGCGKSTLARTINGLVQPSSGRVLVDGLDTAKQGRQVRARVGFVFTDPDNQIVMPTVAEDVAFSLRKSGLSRTETQAKVAETLRRFGLTDHADQPTHLLSGGQKQLLALAAVLVREPRIVVADEPTTLLDLRNARAVATLLDSLDQQLILVTHHLHLLDGFDRVLVMDEGRVVADDAPGPALAAYRALVDA